MLSAGCFPHNARHRTIAEITEGAVAVTGIVIEGFVQSGADCDMNAHAPGEPPIVCKQDASTAGGIGVALILAGIVGFIATISAAEDDDKPKPIEIKAQPEPGPTIVVPNGNPPPPAPAPAPTPAPAT
ncbi:MAG: hypothetical protein ABI678_18325 [Kofleriaceae bacterium]